MDGTGYDLQTPSDQIRSAGVHRSLSFPVYIRSNPTTI